MTYKLIIPGRLDGYNTYIDACRANKYKGLKVKARNEEIVILAISKHLRKVHIDKPVYMRYAWYERNRKRDLDNVSSFGRKVIQDALVSKGVLSDDGWKNIKGFSDEFYVDNANPRIEVEIEVVE